LSAILHTLHVVLAGSWLGGVVFTTLVVSPALMAMKWPEPERVLVRSAIGKRYAKVGGANLVLLLVFALLDGLAAGFGAAFYAGYALLGVVFCLVGAHGAYFGRRLANLAEAETSAENLEVARTLAERRRSLGRLSARVSLADLLVSAAILILAVNAA
jgi:uncharacterized membrane protein